MQTIAQFKTLADLLGVPLADVRYDRKEKMSSEDQAIAWLQKPAAAPLMNTLSQLLRHAEAKPVGFVFALRELDETSVEDFRLSCIDSIEPSNKTERQFVTEFFELLFPASKTESPKIEDVDAESLHDDAVEKLRTLAVSVLDCELTRKFILKHNRLKPSTSREDLSHAVFSAHKSMTFLDNCIGRDTSKFSSDELDVSSANIMQLAQIVMPVCLEVAEQEELKAHLAQNATHAELGTRHVAVGKSVIGFVKGLPVQLSQREEWDEMGPEDFPVGREWITAVPHLPEDGFGGQAAGATNRRVDIVEVFKKGLHRFLDADTADLDSVQAALTTRADKHVFVCAMFPGPPVLGELKKLNKAFPELILLVSRSCVEPQQNNIVLNQLKQLKSEFGRTARRPTS